MVKYHEKNSEEEFPLCYNLRMTKSFEFGDSIRMTEICVLIQTKKNELYVMNFKISCVQNFRKL